ARVELFVQPSEKPFGIGIQERVDGRGHRSDSHERFGPWAWRLLLQKRMAFHFICAYGCKAESPGICPDHLTELLEAGFHCSSCAYAALEEGDCPYCRTELVDHRASTDRAAAA